MTEEELNDFEELVRDGWRFDEERLFAISGEVRKLRAECAQLAEKGDRQREELNFCAERIRLLKIRSRKIRFGKREALQTVDLVEDEIEKLRSWQRRAKETLEATAEYMCHECIADCGCIGCEATKLLKEAESDER